MPTVVREDLGNLQAVLSITIEQADYRKKFESEISKLQQKAQIKGFRKGKTPTSLVKNLYGRGILLDIINDLLQEELLGYISQEDVHLLGQPIQSEDQELYDFDAKELQDYVFRFDIGLAPEFELIGLDHSSVFEPPVVDITEEILDEQVEAIRQRNAQRQEVEPPYEDKDLLTFEAQELDEAGAVHPDGHSTQITMLLEDAAEEAKAALRELPIEGAIAYDVYQLEKDRDEAFVRKYLLQLAEEDEVPVGRMFQLTLEKAERQVLPELNQELFDQVFGPDVVHDEQEMRDLIRQSMAADYRAGSDALLFRDIQNRLLEINPLPLPDAFLRRWLKQSNSKATDEVLDREYPAFAKNLQWSLIRSKIAKTFELQVFEEEIFERFKLSISGYLRQMPGLDDNFLNSMVNRMMQDEKEVDRVAEEILSDKILAAARQVVTVTPKPVSLEAFMEINRIAREEAMAIQQSIFDEEE